MHAGGDLTIPIDFSTSAESLGVVLGESQLQQLAQFARLLGRWNKKFNLLSRQDIGRLWERHVLDSLSILRFFQPGPVLDAGCGAGFPGLPLAIASPEQDFMLVDRSARKIRFVELVASTLGLSNVSVRCADVGHLKVADTGHFTTITSRALGQPDLLWAATKHLLAVRGRLILMTGVRKDENVADLDSSGLAQAGVHDLKIPGAMPGAIVEPVGGLKIPGLAQRHEVLIIHGGDGLADELGEAC